MTDDPTLATRVMEWSRPVIAVFGLALFAIAFLIAYRKADPGTLNILVGAVVALVSTISGYYFGSSSGSAKKDDAIHPALAAVTAALAAATAASAKPPQPVQPQGPQ